MSKLFDKDKILNAAIKAGISADQAELLWKNLNDGAIHSSPSRLDFSRVLYFVGAMIVLLGMGWFLGIAWDKFGAGYTLLVCIIYILGFLNLGNSLWKKNETKDPGGLFITLAICMVPITVYSFQSWTGWWITTYPGNYKSFLEWIRSGWFSMELMTVLSGCLALQFYSYPLLTLPIYFSLWFMSMDAAPLIFGNAFTENQRLWVSVIFGLGLLAIAYREDLKHREDYARWGYIFGMIALWCGLSLLDSPSEFNKFLYCLINICFIVVSVILQRNVFLVFGVIGVVLYISQLFYRLFSDSTLFPFALSAIGLGIIYLGIKYRKNKDKVYRRILNTLPFGAEKWIPNRNESSNEYD